MPIDRESTLRQAEKLFRQGRLDAAIAEYVRLVEDQPRDWNSINTLGDLYLRVGDVERAIAQFVRIADHLFAEGFLPKASALYKKALKARPDDEHTLLRLSEIAAAQELLADARGYLRQLWDQRSRRGDDRGAAECLVRLALLDEADAETKLTGARAAKSLGNTQQAVALFRAAAEHFEQAGRQDAARDAIADVVALDRADAALRISLARRYVAAGKLEQAAPLIDRHSVGSDPDLLLALGRVELGRGDQQAAHAALTQLMSVAPDRSSDVLRLAGEVAHVGHTDQAFTCTDVVVDDALLRGDWDQAIALLQSFVEMSPHIPALSKLAAVAADCHRYGLVETAERHLADAYLAAGQASEAHLIAERLLRRQSDGSSSSAPAATTVADPVRVEQDDLTPLERPRVDDLPSENLPDDSEGLDVLDAEESTILEVTDATLLDATDVPLSLPRTQVHEPPPPMEVDLSDALAALGGTVPVPLRTILKGEAASAPPTASKPSAPDATYAPQPLLQKDDDALVLYQRGSERLGHGQVEDGVADLESAALVPTLRFAACARLGRFYMAVDDLGSAVEWLERAAETAVPPDEDGLSVLYDLASALESSGEYTRALALFMDIVGEQVAYRDVRERIDRLNQTREGRHA